MEPMLRTSPPAVTEVGEPESAAEGKSEEDRNTTDDKLESTRTKMGEVKRENERLKSTLAQIMKDYQSLEMHYFDIIKQDQRETSVREEHSNANHQTDESELSLSLGTSSSGGQKKEEKAAAAAASMVGKTSKDQDDQLMKGVLTLGLDSRFNGSCSDHRETQRNASPGSSVEEIKEEDAPADKVFNSVGRSEEDGDALGLNPAKRARVSVRVRCDAPTMNDGCQWRKYGQKIAKGNPCPRAYYRCTVAPSCPVRKQVQRCPEDMSILITTYEGTHNHPLPVSAAAMASTTSAAASMLMSGSSVSRPLSSGAGDYAGGNSVAAGLHGLSFGLSDLSRQRQLIYPPNSSMYSSSPSCPTITLDLTAPASSSSTPTQLISRLSGYPPKTLNNFSISQSSSMATATTTWNSAAGHLQYFPTHPFASRSGSEIGISSLGSRQPHQEAQMYNSLIQKATQLAPLAGTQGSLTDTAIAAAAKVITSDPSFQSALAAAITSIVGGNGGSQVSVAEPPRGRSNSVWEEKSVPTLSPFAPPSTNGSGCGSSFLTKSSSSSSSRLDSQQGSALTFIQPPLAVPSSKSTPTSPSDHAK